MLSLLRPGGRISGVFLLRVAGAAAVYLAQVALARWLGRDGYGTYLYALAWLNLLALPGALGLPVAALRFLPAYVGERAWPLARGFMQAGLATALLGGSAVAALAWAAHLLVSAQDGRTLLLAAALAGVPVLAALTCAGELLRALGRVEAGYAPRFLGRPLLLLAGAGLLVWGGALTPLAVVAVEVAALALLALGSLVLLRAGLPAALKAARPAWRPGLWLAVGLPLVLMDGFMVAVRELTVLLLERLGGAGEVALFGAVWSTSNAVLLVSASVAAVAGPRISALHAAGDRAALARYLAEANRWQFWPTAASAALLAVLAVPVLRLFGPAFAEAWPALLVLLLAWTLNAATGFLGVLLSVAGLERQAFAIMLAALAAGLAATALAAPALGATGAALAVLAVVAVRNGWMFLLLRRRLGIDAWVLARP